MTAVTEPIEFRNPQPNTNQAPAVYAESVTSNGVKVISRQRDTAVSRFCHFYFASLICQRLPR